VYATAILVCFWKLRKLIIFHNDFFAKYVAEKKMDFKIVHAVNKNSFHYKKLVFGMRQFLFNPAPFKDNKK